MALVWGCDDKVLRVFMGIVSIGTFLYLALVAGKYLDGYYGGPQNILLGTLSVGLEIPSPHFILWLLPHIESQDK